MHRPKTRDEWEREMSERLEKAQTKHRSKRSRSNSNMPPPPPKRSKDKPVDVYRLDSYILPMVEQFVRERSQLSTASATSSQSSHKPLQIRCIAKSPLTRTSIEYKQTVIDDKARAPIPSSEPMELSSILSNRFDLIDSIHTRNVNDNQYHMTKERCMAIETPVLPDDSVLGDAWTIEDLIKIGYSETSDSC